jgi:hypothetical protein
VAANSADDIILPFPEPPEKLGRLTHIRGSLLASSIQSLRARGLYDRYYELLAPTLRSAIVDSTAGEWLGLEYAVAHYTACNGLGLSPDEQRGMGRDVSRRINETFLGVVVKMARGVGVTPWVLLLRGNVLYSRVLRGGGLQVTKTATKEARIDIKGCLVMDIPYFRNALLGMYESSLELFAERVVLRALPGDSSPGTHIALRVHWI